MNKDAKQIVDKFGAFVASMTPSLSKTIDMSADIIYGDDDQEIGDIERYHYIAIPIKNLNNDAIDKDDLDKLYSIMAFFVDNVMGSGNIYFTNRDGKLVIEIAW